MLPRASRKDFKSAGLDLEIFSRGLAAIGNFFVLDCLSFVERGKPRLLHSRNMNEHVLPARRGLDESVALGRVEPLDRTFSHSQSPRDRKETSSRSPQN